MYDVLADKLKLCESPLCLIVDATQWLLSACSCREPGLRETVILKSSQHTDDLRFCYDETV
jgi:hypothetical protein